MEDAQAKVLSKANSYIVSPACHLLRHRRPFMSSFSGRENPLPETVKIKRREGVYACMDKHRHHAFLQALTSRAVLRMDITTRW